MQMQRQQLRAMLCGPESTDFFCIATMPFYVSDTSYWHKDLQIIHIPSASMSLSLDDVLWKQKQN
jgi:hypothetical protein